MQAGKNHKVIFKKAFLFSHREGMCLKFLFAFSFLALSLQSQDYKADLEKGVSIYGKKAFEVQMEYLFYPSFTAIKPLERETIWMKKKGDKFNLNQFGVQSICNEKYVIIIDREAKIIAIDHKPEKNKGKMDPQLKTALDNAMKTFSATYGLDTIKTNNEEKFSVNYLGTKNGKKGYEFIYTSGEYEKTIIYLDAQNFNVKNIILYYRQAMQIEEGKSSKARVEINFTKQVADPDFPKETFSLAPYVDMKSNGQVIPVGIYKDFTVINHLALPTADQY